MILVPSANIYLEGPWYGFKDMKKNCLTLGSLACMVVLFAGCLNQPLFRPPGTIGYHRSQAVLHDPFPSNDLGPPIMGGRPLGFDRPLSEVVDSQGSPHARRGAAVNPNFGF